MRRTILVFGLLTIAASARILLQLAVMPPYAGLDEVYHVARLAFRYEQGRNPEESEPSIPLYLHESLNAALGSIPVFAGLGPKWPQYVAATLKHLPADRVLSSESREYIGTNYEAQQPSLYYSLAGPLVRLLSVRTQKAELRLWRGLSAFCALITVFASGFVGWRLFGWMGLCAAALLVSFPTWQTFLVRASNDALTCALIAVAISVTFSAPARTGGWVLEGSSWALALAVKLYSWPLLVILPLAWHRQKAPRLRVVIVATLSVAAIVFTMADLASRTNHPLGLFAFDRLVTQARAASVPIDYVEMGKIWIATAVWTSGQHWNALTPLGMLLYFGPIVAICAWAMITSRHRAILQIFALVVVTFALAQAVNAWGYLRSARAQGLPLPAGGKEGWYWYALAPMVILIPLSLVLGRLRNYAIALVFIGWIAGWDVLVHEGALFRDYAGKTSPAQPTALFRWGPLESAEGSVSERLRILAAGPMTGAIAELRIIHLVSLAALAVTCIRFNRQSTAEPGPAPL